MIPSRHVNFQKAKVNIKLYKQVTDENNNKENYADNLKNNRNKNRANREFGKDITFKTQNESSDVVRSKNSSNNKVRRCINIAP
jgi:hypothetical protein